MRPVFVNPNHASTVMMPGDVSPSPARWLDPANGEVSRGNRVRYLIRGEETYLAMRHAIDTASAEGHFIFLLGWSVTLTFPLSEKPGFTTTLGDLLSLKANYSKTKVRGLFWRQADELVSALKRWGPLAAISSLAMPLTPLAGPTVLAELMAIDRLKNFGGSFLGMQGQNFEEVKFINGLTNGVGVLDKHHSPTGSHHQKILLVNGDRGLIAFVGGIDVYPDRIWANGNNGCKSLGAPYEDIHCQIEGPAALDVLRLAVERWKNCGVPEATNDSMDWAATAKPVKVAPSKCSVQLGHTHGNPAITTPKKTGKKVILHAIEQAKRFIYMEDQYLVNMEAAAALNKAVPRLKHLTMLVPHWRISDLPQCTYRRRKFMEQVLDGLSADDAKKVGIYSLGSSDSRFAYIHAKSWFFDDECAIIGSANCNRRGWDSDSEVVAAVVEEVDPADTELTFAHRTRMELWAKHLSLKPWQVVDGVASLKYWRQPPVDANIERYKTSDHDGFDHDIDPDAVTQSKATMLPKAVYDDLWELIDPP
jgi:hypothetical protein